jgi:glycine C-acetyltransferase
MKEERYSIKDFSLSLDMDMFERAKMFQLWIDQNQDHNHNIYWTKSNTGIKSRMNVLSGNDNQNRDVISFVSNDYLGMSDRKETKEAGKDAIDRYGNGACAAPVIGGYLDMHRKLELELASFTGMEDALIFSAGFGTNTGLLNCLLGENDIALYDSYVHTSIMDGLKGTNRKNIGHNDLEYLEMTLDKVKDSYTNKLVIIDGVYSQDGDLGLLPGISKLCKEYGAYLMVDDAHGFGIMGKDGRGTLEHFGMLGQADLMTGTFSKSFGCVGGFAAASKNMIQYLRYYANTTMFSAAVAPAVTASVSKAIQIIKEQPCIRKKLWNNVKYLKQLLDEAGIDYHNTESPIFPIMIRNNFKAKEAASMLMRKGIYTNAICFPAVRHREARLRVSILSTHSFSDIETLVSELVKIDKTIHFI